MPDPAIPPLARAALLLDLDGTLLDIAPTPDGVTVAPGLPGTLRRLRVRLGGALAIVTGRPLDQVDALLPGIAGAVAAEHGSTLRFGADAPMAPVPHAALPAEWFGAASALATAHPGALLERKRHGFALHYRAAPEAGPALRDALRALLGGTPGVRLLAAKMAWEVRPDGADKGSATRAIMAAPPFAGRIPVFVGDDVTDEDGIAAAEALGGTGLRVGPTLGDAAFGDAAGVRGWLSRLARSP